MTHANRIFINTGGPKSVGERSELDRPGRERAPSPTAVGLNFVDITTAPDFILSSCEWPGR